VGTVHHVFSYGTLRQAEVQRTLYGREVPTSTDELPGFRIDWLRITDPTVITTSRSDLHPILRRGSDVESVSGVVLALTDDELTATDAYEVADYARRAVTLASGVNAWAYLATELSHTEVTPVR
jgi:gamma-glutamylcyclotransferase (GGCT)/AIG2-like uncharacterized protein YtfP